MFDSNKKQATEPLKSLNWTGDHLDLLDQRLLPEEIVYIKIKSAQDAWEAIKQLKVRGAPAIGITAAYGLYLEAREFESNEANLQLKTKQWYDHLKKTTEYLATSRPTAVNLFWALERMKERTHRLFTHIEKPSIEFLNRTLLDEAQKIQAEDEETCRFIGVHALTLFHDGDGILTHCNAGGLATAKYGTALSPIYLAKEQGIQLKIFADETRPVLQGARLTAFELHQAGIDVTLICDNMAGMIMSKGWIQAVIVGTDRVAANGDVANKIGTYSVAVLAKAHGIPFYVACPLSTIDLNTPSGQEIPIEERHEDEITMGFGKRTAPLGVKVFNPAFDITPHEYVTAIITEKGIVYPSYRENLVKLFD